MANVLQDNTLHLQLGSWTVTTEFVEVEFQQSNNTQEITAGVGQASVQRGEGLDDHTFNITVMYDTVLSPSVFTQMKAGTILAFDFGPEDNTAGKPRHTQNVIIQNNSFGKNVDKSPTSFQIQVQGADTPTTDMFAGGTW